MMATSMRNPRRGADAQSGWDSAASRYEVMERVGEGTLFVAYRVKDRSTNRVLALKALKSAFSRHQRFAPALAQASQRTLELNHPNLARTYEVGEEEGTLFVVTEWLPGASLESRLRRTPFSRSEAIADVRQIAEALSYLHQNGAVHGDLRPRQVLGAADGTLKLTEAGVADAFTTAGVPLNDVEHDATYYMAPERFDGAPPTAASDLYAVGVILYRMLTGRVPFDGPSPLSIAMRHRNDAPLKPSQFNRNCPPELEAITLRLLAKHPQERYASANHLLRDLIVGPGRIAQAGIATPTADTPTRPARGDGPATNGTASAAVAATVAAAPVVTTPVAAAPPVIAAPPIAAAASSVVANGVAAVSDAVVEDEAPPPRPVRQRIRHRAPAPAPSAPPTSSDVDGDGGPDRSVWEEEEERNSLKRQTKVHRKRERNGALLALLWTLIAAGLLAGIVYGAYYFWVKDIPHDVVVPKYQYLSIYEAQRKVEAVGLKMHVQSERYDTKHASGTVLWGDKEAGAKVKIGHDIGVTVSRGEEQVPMVDLSEITLERARQILVQNGMRLGQIAEQYHDTIPKGYICGQYPEPGQPSRRSEPINLIVSRGPQPTEVAPDGSALPPAPEPPAVRPDDGRNQSPITAAPEDTPQVTMVSRDVRVRVAIPSGGQRQEVRVVVADAEGEHVLYRRNHNPGELVDQLIHVPRQQGATATVRVYVGGVLQFEKNV